MAAAIGPALGIAGGILGGLSDAPSKAMIDLNNNVQSFSQYMTAQAQQEGIAASTTFNNLMGPLQRIVQGGPNQAGWSQAQFNAYNTSVIQKAASAARDEKAVVGNSVPGGPSVGNTGTQGTNVADIANKTEGYTSAAEAEGIQKSYAQGNENFFKAAGEEKELPSVYSTSNTANEEAGKELTAAETSQQNIDTAKRASSGLGIASKALSGAGSAASVFTGGAGGGDTAQAVTGALKTPGTSFGGGSNPAPDVSLGMPTGANVPGLNMPNVIPQMPTLAE